VRVAVTCFRVRRVSVTAPPTYLIAAGHLEPFRRGKWHAPSSRHLRALLSVCGGVHLGVWGVVLVVCVCVGVEGVVLCRCVCVCVCV